MRSCLKTFLAGSCDNAQKQGFKVEQWVNYKNIVEKIIKQCEINKNFINDICFYHDNPDNKNSNDTKEKKAYEDYTKIIDELGDLDTDDKEYTKWCRKLRKFVTDNKSYINNYILKNSNEFLAEESLARYETDCKHNEELSKLLDKFFALRNEVFKLKEKPKYNEKYGELKKFAEENKEVLEGEMLFQGYTYSVHYVLSEDFDVKLDRKNSASVDPDSKSYKFSDL